jgi:hypothetical protein
LAIPRHRSLVYVVLVLVSSVVASILPEINGINAVAATTTPKVLVLNTSNNRLDGVSLISGTPSKHVGLAQSRLLPALESKMGAVTVISSTMCREKLPVKVAEWKDLSVVFEGGRFALLLYNYGGWSHSHGTHPPLPPVGVALRPLVKTNFGATVGDSAARLMSLNPRLRGDSTAFYVVSAFTTLVMTKRSGAISSNAAAFLVSQIEVATGNC